MPCATGTVCDVSDDRAGACVDPQGACVTTSAPEACGDKVCGPGSACDGKGKCYPRVPCGGVACDTEGCHGVACACTRPVGCEPAPLGTLGETGTLLDASFRKGLVDLEFDPMCGAWGVTLIGGPDYLRHVGPDGAVNQYAGVTNINMGEVSVLQRLSIPTSHEFPMTLDAPGLDVSLSYICCATCGCQLDTTPQGASRLEPSTGMLPLVIQSKSNTAGAGPFGSSVIDSGPSGLTYGTDRVLYLGNVNENGDYYRLDLTTQTQTLVTTFAARVHAATPFDAISLLVALEGGEVRLLRVDDGTSTVWATSDSPITGMVRDFFDGAVYLARRDGQIWKYDEKGKGAVWQSAANPARIAIAPNGWLYALEIPPPYYDHDPTIERWQLPTTR
ncbi:Hypothetical protein A7982_07764 [Minicystis rosea]|nr:Hypothetical protein A7982_07764 [Minicystis rosea]